MWKLQTIYATFIATLSVPVVPFCCFMEVLVFFLSSGGTFTLNLAALNHSKTASSVLRIQCEECVSHRAAKSFHKILFIVSHRLLKPNRMTSPSKFPLRGCSQDWCKQKGTKSNYYLWIRWHFCQLWCVYGCIRAWRPQWFGSSDIQLVCLQDQTRGI